ncbi:PTS transporter subunit EIIA [Coprococcus eutactus]|jgi:PTS system, fru family, IIC component|uniref:PTS sugar transporter subunit IIA n=2 Tax=Coprococcus TaxID=33042 RepID=A0A8I0AE06_9FIRM|nr:MULTISPECIES: fructose-specific PTS transporter subunit EIIC [Coprococcus]SCI15455.1 EIIABC-Fru [uncultured Coprococcus sp.]MBC5662098.1 PTS sugar transporter subunit IIA [Coprococcus hominis (ex Liu et al. 2022)]MCB5504538.1 fructose-specific PTS transporter subunit EIIC [Coprococcus eutactus]MCU6731491.1 fructose-specific PTS transporter subunit EIIC [Coprococcus ammoniilyticus]NSC96346.1 PTS transporter subunit EIIA [Coprococcus eutactus]
MRIRELLKKEGIALGVKVDSKDAAIDYLIDLHAKSGNITDKAEFKKGILAREESGSTGVGEGIAIPHSKNAAVKQPGLAAMTVPDGVDYDSLDGQPANLFFMIAAPEKGADVHLEVLSRLSMLLMDENFRAELLAAKNADQFLDICSKYEMEKFADELGEATEDKKENAPEKTGYRVLAVTACPTGIAHTFMAAEALEKKGNEMGISIKVETNGSGGVKNRLTAKEIEECDGIIVAADKNVETARFDGKPVLFTKVADGIHKPEELINKVIDGKVSVHHESGKKAEEESAGGVGSQIYKHLMSGVSHMLPFVIGGGIMIALAFLIDTICGYGSTGGSNFGTCTPLSAFFKYVGDLSMGLMVPVLAGYIAYSIADRPGLAVGFTGGLLASSGNAAIAKYIWAGASLSPFQNFIAKFGFVGEGSGNTVSGFLGGILAGFLAGYIVLLLKKMCSKFPQSLEGIKPTLIYPLVGIFLVGVLMVFIFNPLIGLINTGLSNMLTSLADKNLLALLGLILGAMMAIDMGGPINKAAYVFGSGMLSTAADLVSAGASQSDAAVQACYISMAAVMIGGMVPPMGIALACKLFPKKFTKAERGSAVSNFVMGCSFITEGAIPFAAADPLHVIPCTLVGAGVAGALSAAFKCTLMAPHGGIFVFATVGHPLFYILSWVIGSVVTCLLLGLIKKNVAEE